MGPKPASLWWTSICGKKVKKDMVIETAGGKHKLPFEDEFRLLENLFSRDGRSQISLLVYRFKSVLWKIKCQRVIDQENSVFLLRMCELELEPGNLWIVSRLFRMLKEDVTVQSYGMRTARTARSIWKQQTRLLSLTELIADGTWRAKEWVQRRKEKTP